MKQQEQDQSADLAYKRKLLEVLGAKPTKCPIEMCTKHLYSTDWMAHLLEVHFTYDMVFVSSIFKDKFHWRFNLSFNEMTLNKSYIVQMFLYGGESKLANSKPGIKLLTLPNTLLPYTHLNLKNHMPMVMYASKMNRQALGMPVGWEDPYYVIWLVGTITSEPVWISVVLNRPNDTAPKLFRILVRSFNNTQDPQYFQDNECVTLTQKEVDYWKNSELEFTLEFLVAVVD